MHDVSSERNSIRWLGLFLGPLLCALMLWLLPSEFERGSATTESDVNLESEIAIDDAMSVDRSHQPSYENPIGPIVPSSYIVPFSWAGRATLGVMVWMGVWWLTEAIHISATSLLPIAILPLLRASTIREACSPYADPLVFLYFGGFVLALSMERWGLGKRIALMTLKVVGTTARNMVAGFMLVTAVLSAFVSNTATTAMMLPIAMSVVALLRRQDEDAAESHQQGANQFGTCLLLAIAYSASVGGIMTVVGTPTNAFLIGFMRDKIAEPYRQDISFVGWLPIGVPFTLVFLPIMYLVLTRLLFPIRHVAIVGGRELIDRELSRLGSVNRGEWNTLFVFAITVLLWLFRPLIAKIEFNGTNSIIQPFGNLTDPGIAMLAAVTLFLLPTDVRKRSFTMEWQTVERMPWGILMLFGGGLSLAAAIQANGVAEFIGSQAGLFRECPEVLLVLIVTTAIVFLTELTSNAATTASLVPVLSALAPGLGVHPYLLIVPATVAASCAFMLPVATPPNAIVFGSGAITIPDMLRAGIVLNLVSIALVTLLAIVVIRPWFGI